MLADLLHLFRQAFSCCTFQECKLPGLLQNLANSHTLVALVLDAVSGMRGVLLKLLQEVDSQPYVSS